MVRQRELGVDGAHVDDGAGRRAAFASPLPDHLAGHGLRHQKRSAQIDAEHAVEFLDGEIEEGRIVDHAGVVHQDVDPAESLECCRECALDVAGLGYVARHINRLAALGFDALGPRSVRLSR